MAKVTEATKDESRFAYKNFSEVLDMQKDSIEILHFIKPIINIKG
jgi:tRNA-splicing ligase RtcB (3'-phosphate/5'-hydroxy nucleic acid ligase)